MRFIRGLFNRTIDIAGLQEILIDHNEFYKKYEPRTEKGVIKDNTVVEVLFVRNNILHKISASSITNSVNQTITVEKYDRVTDTWVPEESEGYIDFFQYEHYSQKQIYEIAQKPNSLRERIDRSVEKLEELKAEREIIRRSFLEKSASIRTKQGQLSGKGRLQTDINDLGDQILLYHESGIASLLTSRESFSRQEKHLKNFVAKVESREESIKTLADQIGFLDIDYAEFEQSDSEELKILSKAVVDGYEQIKAQLQALQDGAELLRSNFENAVENSAWKSNFIKNNSEFSEKKLELEQQGINDILKFESLTESKANKSAELARLLLIEISLTIELQERTDIKSQFLKKTKEIYLARKEHVETLMQDDKIKISIAPFRDKSDFALRLRAILQKPTGFDNDIDYLTELAFNGNTEQKIEEVKQAIFDLKEGILVPRLSGYFRNLINNISEPQFDELELLWPEDDISIKYKPSGHTTFKPLSTASAGQKTTAILTIILSQGNIPLLLDQPEDDLDNRLVYELIVDRLNQAKEYRQIIVVTHNANIPVNGDAEYIISMDSESKSLSVLHSGTVEDRIIKKEICDVMEGTEFAFDMRSKRYKSIV